jgi:hypothetical protein
MTQDPMRRLRNDPSASERLRRDLEHAQTHAIDFDVEVGLRKLGAALGRLESGATALHGGTATGAGHVRLLATKWWVWSSLSAATLGLVWWTQTDSSPSSARRQSASEQSAPTGERAESPDALGLPPSNARATELQGRATGQGAVGSRKGASNALGANQNPTHERASVEPVSGRGQAVRAPLKRERATRTSGRSHDAEAVPSAVRVASTGTARSGEHVASDSHSGTEQAVAGALATQPAAPNGVSVPTSAPAATAATAASDTADHRLQAEVEHLARVRRLLTQHPARALEAAREGQNTFVDGLFREERAALIVFSLARLERKQEALREAEDYLRDYPRGPFAVPVSELLTRYKDREP